MKADVTQEEYVNIVTQRNIIGKHFDREGNKRSKGVISKIDISDNIWFHRVELPKKGDIKPGHTHKFSHVTLVASGAVEVYRITDDGEELIGVGKEDDKIIVPATHAHKLVALEDNTVTYCIEYIHNIKKNK